MTDDIFSAFGIEDEAEKPVEAKAGRDKPYLPSFPGRQSKDDFSLQELARKHTEDAFEVLLEIMNHGEDDSTRLEAAKQILDRGWGKPTVQVKSQTVSYNFEALETKILEYQEEMSRKMLEAQKIEDANLRYLIEDVEVLADASSSGQTTL